MKEMVWNLSRALVGPIAALAALSVAAQAPLVEQGRADLRRGDYSAAMKTLEAAVAQAPKDPQAHLYLGNAYASKAAKSGMFVAAKYGPKARSEWERAAGLDPRLVDARFSLVEFYTFAPGFMGGSYDKAFEQAKEIKAIDPLRGHRAYALVYTHQKKYGAAFEELESALKIDPGYMPAYYHLGRVASLANANLSRGEEAMRKYVAYTPKDDEPALARAHYFLGAILEKEGKTGEAKESYGAALRLDPSLKEAEKGLKRTS